MPTTKTATKRVSIPLTPNQTMILRWVVQSLVENKVDALTSTWAKQMARKLDKVGATLPDGLR